MVPQAFGDPRASRHGENAVERRPSQVVIDEQGPLAGASQPDGQLHGQGGLALALDRAGDHDHADAAAILAQEQPRRNGIDGMVHRVLFAAVALVNRAHLDRVVRQQRHGADHRQPQPLGEVCQRVDAALADVPPQYEQDHCRESPAAGHGGENEAGLAVGQFRDVRPLENSDSRGSAEFDLELLPLVGDGA